MIYALLLMLTALVWEAGAHPERYQLRASMVSLAWLLASVPVVLFTGPFELRAFALARSAGWGSAWLGSALFVPVLVVVDDWLHYWVHRGAHHYSVAWRWAHRVHHSSPDFNLLVAVRFSFVGHLTGAVLPWLGLVLVGFPAREVIAVRAWNMVYQWLCHVRWGSGLPSWVSRVFVTGDSHALHHASNACYWDGNFGAVFSCWDRWFGTELRELPGEVVVYGVNRGDG